MIWVPSILFFNTRDHLTSKNDDQTFITVSKRENGTLMGPAHNEDTMVYKGSRNELMLSRVYEVNFICIYDMQYYPFDVQICTIDMIMAGSTDMFIDLRPGKLHYSGEKDLSQYYVMDFKMIKAKIKNSDGVRVS